MIRLDKACDLSPFTDPESSRFVLSAVRFTPPNKDDVAAEYRELRKPREKRRSVHKPQRHGNSKRMVREFVGMETMPASEAYRIAKSKLLRGHVEATDGKRLVRVPCLNGDEFPQTSGAAKEPQECLIPANYLKEALGRIPRKTFKPVLASARLTQTDSRNEVILSTTNGERSTDETVRQVDGRFPRTQDVWPKEAPIATVNLSAKLLESIVKHARTHCPKDNESIQVIIRGDDSAVEFHYSLDDERTVKALLMPM